MGVAITCRIGRLDTHLLCGTLFRMTSRNVPEERHLVECGIRFEDRAYLISMTKVPLIFPPFCRLVKFPLKIMSPAHSDSWFNWAIYATCY